MRSPPPKSVSSTLLFLVFWHSHSVDPGSQGFYSTITTNPTYSKPAPLDAFATSYKRYVTGQQHSNGPDQHVSSMYPGQHQTPSMYGCQSATRYSDITHDSRPAGTHLNTASSLFEQHSIQQQIDYSITSAVEFSDASALVLQQLHSNTPQYMHSSCDMGRSSQFTAHAPPVWYPDASQSLSDLDQFDFDTIADELHDAHMSRQDSHIASISSDYTSSGCSTGIQTPVMRGMTGSPLPMAHTQMDALHGCRWLLSGDQPCGQVFTSVQDLHGHIHKDHIKDLEPVGKDGYVCGWEGCARQKSDAHKDKRGFDGKSKLKRHLSTHAGSSTFSTLATITWQSLPLGFFQH